MALEKLDEKNIRTAIRTLSYSDGIDEATLVRRVYSMALTEYASLSSISGDGCSILEKIFSDSDDGDAQKLREMALGSKINMTDAMRLLNQYKCK